MMAWIGNPRKGTIIRIPGIPPIEGGEVIEIPDSEVARVKHWRGVKVFNTINRVEAKPVSTRTHEQVVEANLTGQKPLSKEAEELNVLLDAKDEKIKEVRKDGSNTNKSES